MASRARSTRAILTAAVGLMAACGDEPPTAATPISRTSAVIQSDENDIPPTGTDTKLFHWSQASDSALWTEAISLDSTFAVGIKAPGSPRGMYRGRLLLTGSEWEHGRVSVAAHPGVQVTQVDDLLPYLRVKLASISTLTKLRRLPFVDYVEPAALRIRSMSGCDQDQYGGADNIQVPTPGHYRGYDLAAQAYDRVKITRAWHYSSGRGVTIGLTDTGVDNYTTGSEFGSESFAMGQSTGRWISQKSVAGHNFAFPLGCTHGARMAGILAAPRNGRHMVGVAYSANLFSVHQADSPNPDATDAKQAIRDAAQQGGAGVIIMGWGVGYYSDGVANEIFYWAQNLAGLDRMFVAAAGTAVLGDFFTNNNNVVFPAELDVVLAVSGARVSDPWNRPDDMHYGDELDLIGFTNSLSTGIHSYSGTYDQNVTKLGGSSGATALVGGVAALVRARYPDRSRDWVMQRIVSTAGGHCGAPEAWHKMVNAVAAVGGICASALRGATSILAPANGYVYMPYTLDIGLGNGPLRLDWSDGTSEQIPGGATPTSRSHNFRFRGGFTTGSVSTQQAWVRITDLGSSAPLESRLIDVRVTTGRTEDGECVPGGPTACPE